MNYSLKNNVLIRDKYHFFSQLNTNEEIKDQLSGLDKKTNEMGYYYLLNNKAAIESEFIQSFSKLIKEKNTNERAFWLYCYYCASMLEAFYKAYAQESSRQEYEAIKIKIKEFLADQKKQVEEERFIQYLKKSFVNGIQGLAKSPLHVAQVRDYIAYTNICRIQWVFTRLTLTKGLELLRDLHWIEQLDVLLGTHTNVDKIISVLQAPTFVLNYFSVGLFLGRFVLDVAMLIKHTFFPSELEKKAETSAEIHQLSEVPSAKQLEHYKNTYLLIKNENQDDILLYYISMSAKIELLDQKKEDLHQLEKKLGARKSRRLKIEDLTRLTGHTPETCTRMERFKYELYKRQCNFANDLVWATVNFLCNFNHITKISGPVTGYLTAAFLVFDTAMFAYKRRLAKKEYLLKKAQYDEELRMLTDMTQLVNLTESQRIKHIDILNHQLKSLEIEWKKKESTFYFCASAATLLALGFTASMLLNPAIMVLASYFVCTVGVAMYLSSGSYMQFKEKSLYLERAELSGDNELALRKEYEIARNDFIYKMVKNTVMPTLLIATFALYWPAAIILSAMYMGYELYHTYSQHSGQQEAQKLAAP